MHYEDIKTASDWGDKGSIPEEKGPDRGFEEWVGFWYSELGGRYSNLKKPHGLTREKREHKEYSGNDKQ